MTPFPPRRRAGFSRSALGRWCLWLTAPLVALASVRYLAFPIAEAAPHFTHHVAARAPAFYAHVTLAAVALGLLPLQLSARLRARRPGLHRWSGRLAAACMTVGGVSGIWLAAHVAAGPSAAFGFGLLGALWIACAGLGVATALRRDLAAHRAWMIRAAALTMAALSLRLQLPVAMALGQDYDAAATWIAWSCWVPNLLIAEAYLRRGRAPAAAVPA
ncbi:DUF2306 domain-containing protein [Rhodovulum sp. DZ06]|uniref:DUF2306 domain-containing protein n=1 Tax=Rhodovulum sp. DZ06 TaxID=3425126 RepID=UPI003D33F117